MKIPGLFSTLWSFRKRAFPAVFSLMLLFLFTSCQPAVHNEPRRALFSGGWYFVRLAGEDGSSVQQQQVQTGRDWRSQYNIETVNMPAWDGSREVDTRKELGTLPRDAWEPVTLPHTAFIEPLVVRHPWQGICYYRKTFFVPAADSARRFSLHFEGAMQEAIVWVNGRRAAYHAGGYTPFEVQLDPLLHYGDSNEVLVRLDNRDDPLIPPGKPSSRLDFCYYSGLYRDVWLVKTGKVFIPDAVAAGLPAAGGVFVTVPEATLERARLHIRTTLCNASFGARKISVVQVLHDRQGRIVSRCGKEVVLSPGDTLQVDEEMSLRAPHLWDIEDPYLYTLESRLEEKGKLLDRLETRTGIRRIVFSRQRGFLLNGRPVKLTGTNRHQEYPYIGNAQPDPAQYRDMVKIKEGGFNIVRLGHYPQDPAVLEACDELGLLVIEPIPGWQFFNSDTLFVERTFRDIRDMIRRDRNHPSVVMWETVLNESRLPMWWKKKAYAIAHEEYPGDQCYTSGDMYGTYVWDVLYNDWHEDFTRPNDSDKPGFIREYGDYEFGGNESTSRQRRGAGEKGLLQSAWNFQWSFNRYNAYYPRTSGNATWEMYDHNRGCCPTISASGAADIFRIPKFTWHFFRSQKDPGSLLACDTMRYEVFIASYWTPRPGKGKVVVYGNVEEVELRLNGKAVARQKPDHGPDTPYFYAERGEKPWQGGHPFDGGNGRHLAHPPFTFTGIPWQEGTLEAVGLAGGREVCRYTVRTPGNPDHLVLSVDLSGKRPRYGEKDVLFVYVKITDKKGTLCVEDNSSVITLQADGARILSPEKIQAEAGIATFLIETGDAPLVRLMAANGSGLETGLRLQLEMTRPE